MCVCAMDTELLGHWWYEGVQWLDAVVDEAARQGLTLTTLDDALERHESGPPCRSFASGAISWGEGEDLRTWSGPAVADLAWQVRTAELRALARGARPSERALRELLALQSSDWAFLASTRDAGEYPRERAAGHAEALAASARRGRGARAGAAEPRARARRLGRLTASVSPSGTSAARRASGSASPGSRRRPRSAGTSAVTTALVPITELSPTVTPRSTQAP